MSEEYDIRESLKSVRQLYPVLLDANGEVIDGFHRLDVDENWRTETLEHIKTPTQLYLARIVANTHRRIMSAEEREEQVTKLADSLLNNDKVPRGDVVRTIVDLTGLSYRTVVRYVPEEYKDLTKVDAGRQKAKSAATVAAETDQEEAPSLEDYLKDYFEKTYSPDTEFLLWILFKNYGLSEKEARKAIAKAGPRKAPETEKTEKEQPARESKPAKYEAPQSPTCKCPLCGRDGADKTHILANFVEDTRMSQTTLFTFITEAFIK